MSTTFGVLPNIGVTTVGKIAIVKAMHVDHVRTAAIIEDWSGHDALYERYEAEDFKIGLNVNNSRNPTKPMPFPANMQTYGATFKNIAATYKPAFIAVENEEINKNYHTGTMKQYVTMLSVAYPICKSQGIRMTNGGIYGVGLDGLVYKWLRATHRASDADEFAAYTLLPGQINYLNGTARRKNTDLQNKMNDITTLLDGFKTFVDFVNLHEYEVLDNNAKPEGVASATTNVLRFITEYILAYTGKRCISNEFGQRDNQQPDLTRSMMQQYIDLGIEYAFVFNGNGTAGSEAYTSAAGELNELGMAWVEVVQGL